MNLRDIAIVAALVVVAGFAVVDAIRDGGAGRRSNTSSDTRGTTRAEGVPLRAERFPPVPTVGLVAFTDARDCRLREAVAGSGRERLLPRIETACVLWGAPFGRRLAVAVPPEDAPAAAFRFVDLDAPGAGLGGGRVLGPIVWSADAERAAWCESATSGIELKLEGESRPLSFCPRAYLGARALAHTRDRELLVDGRVAVRGFRHIEAVLAAVDGSYALVFEGGRIERRARGRLTHMTQLPSALVGSTLVLSPDGCAAAGVTPTVVSVVDLGCFRGRDAVTTVSPDNCVHRASATNSECARYLAPRAFEGFAAAWSPDGTWIAVAEPSAIAFHRVVGGYRVIRWRAGAAALAWLRA